MAADKISHSLLWLYLDLLSGNLGLSGFILIILHASLAVIIIGVVSYAAGAILACLVYAACDGIQTFKENRKARKGYERVQEAAKFDGSEEVKEGKGEVEGGEMVGMGHYCWL